MNLDQMVDAIEKLQSAKRFKHSLGVKDVAYDLALIYGYDTMKASIAAILHDCAKHLSDDELIGQCNIYNLPVSKYEMQSKFLLHAKVGALYARKLYGVEDEDILDAITYHTTGRPSMTLLEKIIFTADYIEPNRRPIPRLNTIRKEAYFNLDQAVYIILENTLDYLKTTNNVIDEMTIKAYEYYRKLIEASSINS
ncbi:MAG: HD domain-containing protein [Clostridiales bacterium]|nr:HD domain-containing protein [Clostridiales bacterium]